MGFDRIVAEGEPVDSARAAINMAEDTLSDPSASDEEREEARELLKFSADQLAEMFRESDAEASLSEALAQAEDLKSETHAGSEAVARYLPNVVAAMRTWNQTAQQANAISDLQHAEVISALIARIGQVDLHLSPGAVEALPEIFSGERLEHLSDIAEDVRAEIWFASEEFASRKPVETSGRFHEPDLSDDS